MFNYLELKRIEHFDRTLFETINGVAGRWGWLDAAGQYLAVFGLLAVILVVLAVAWWPRLDAAQRRRYLFAMVTAGVTCLLFAGAAGWLAKYVVHHELRARPFNACWVTPLITTPSHSSFPPWSLVATFALLVPMFRAAKRVGYALLAFAILMAVALVFVGANYPFDVLIGGLLGAAIGYSVTAASGLSDRSAHPWRPAIACWLLLFLGSGLLFAGLHAALTARTATSGTKVTGIRVTPPPAALTALQQAATLNKVEIQAASNGHLLVAEARVLSADANIAKPKLDDLARRTVNAAFAKWPRLDLLTVIVHARSPQGKDATLYTATIERAQWPAGGFLPSQRLPGKKFYHARYYK